MSEEDSFGLKKKIEELERELEKKEKEIQQEKNKNKHLKNIPSPVFITNTQEQILAYYGPTSDLIMDPEEFLGKKYSEISLPEELVNKIKESTNEANNKDMSRKEYKIQSENGLAHFSIRTRKSNTEHYVHVINNITEKKEADAALKRSEEQFKTLFYSSPVSILIHDKDTGEITDANPAAYTMYGYSTLDELKQSDMWLEPPYSFKEAKELIKKAAKKGALKFEWKNRKKSGQIFWEQVFLQRIKIDDEYKVLASSIETTEIKKAQMKLKDNEAKLKKITDNVADIILAMDMNLNTTYVSPSIERVLGYSPEEYVQLSLDKRHPVESLKLIQEAYLEELEKEKNPDVPRDRTKIIETLHYKKDGSLASISMHTSFIRDKKGHPVGIQGVTRDITQIKQAEQEKQKILEDLIRINQTQEKIFSVLGHDLRSPFTTILGFSEILFEGYDQFSEDQRKQMISSVLKSSKNAYNLLEELLDWSLASKVEESYNPERLDLREIVSGIQTLNEKSIKEYELNFYNHVFPNTVIEADKQMLSSMVRNLVSNAIKYSNQNGDIYVKAEEKNDNYQIIVQDTGKGFQKEQLEKVFSTDIESEQGSKGEKGLGLGLNLVKRFVDKHKGNIEIDSEYGKGTKIYLTLPKEQKY